MKIASTLADEAILVELGERLTAARLARNLTQADLAREAGVSKRSIERMEAGQVAAQLTVLLRVCRVLGLLERFDALVPEVQPSPIAQLKLQGRSRQRASGGRKPAPAKRKWTWGEP